MTDRVTDLMANLEKSLADAKAQLAAKRAADHQQSAWERTMTVHLDGDKHETMMTERSGLFSVYCGCGWKAQDLRYEDAETAEAAHTAQESGQ